MSNLETSALRPADILLSTGDSAVSTVIRTGSASRYSHAALYVGNGRLVEAIGQGVIEQSLAHAMSDDTLVAVFRRNPLSSSQAASVIRYARRQVGKSYDASGAAGAGGSTLSGSLISFLINPALSSALAVADGINMINSESSFYCSELVTQAYANASVPLVRVAASTTPGQVGSSRHVVLIGKLKG